MSKPIMRETTFAEVMANPAAYGVPTFTDYVRNREKYLGTDGGFGVVDRGSTNLKKYVRKHIYEICGYRAGSLEEVERIAENEGIKIDELEFAPELIDRGGQKCDILIRWRRKGNSGVGTADQAIGPESRSKDG